MGKFPCYECFRRTPTCHSTCEEYLEAKKRADQIRKLEQEECSARGIAKVRKRQIDKHKSMKIWKNPKK